MNDAMSMITAEEEREAKQANESGRDAGRLRARAMAAPE